MWADGHRRVGTTYNFRLQKSNNPRIIGLGRGANAVLSSWRFVFGIKPHATLIVVNYK